MKKPSRILILSGVFLADIAGPPILLKALIKELIKNGYQVSVLTFGQKSEAGKYPYPVKVVSDQWPFFLKYLIYLIKGLVLACGSDILYNQDLYAPGLTSLIIKKILRKKLVTRFVGDSAWETALNKKETTDDILTFQQKRYSASTERRKRIRKRILLNSDKVIVVSHFLRDLAQRIGVDRAKIKVIYNSIGFLEDKTKNLSKEELKKELGLSGRIMLTNARLTPWKGIDMLIEILPDLLKKYSQLKFMVIGQGPEQANLEKLIKNLNLENRVFLLGRVSRQKVIDYLKAADLFVLNTNYEGMSHCLLEAMKTGTSIIATKAGGNPETIRDKETGMLVDYRNKEQWLEAIGFVLDNPALARQMAGNAQKDLQRFSWPDLVRKTINLFQNL